jgi:hypothetical protein
LTDTDNIRHVLIPAALLEKIHQSKASWSISSNPSQAYEAMDRDGTLRFYWPGNMIGYYQSKLLQDSVLVHAWQEVPKSVIVGMLDTIRTRVLTTAIDIKNDLEQSGVELATVKQHSPASEKAQQTIVQQHSEWKLLLW